ncbi:MAG TPA: hypothetical protein GX692_08300, partial [Acholeplasmataceae bacterium]|nr:hypothetical protein [Acholeplasmataceae bacterium]
MTEGQARKVFDSSVIDNTIYMTADALENGNWAKVLVEETTHFSEGTREYVSLINFMLKDEDLYNESFKETAGLQYISPKELNDIIDKLANGRELTADEQKAYRIFAGELNAHMVRNLLGNEAFIDKLVRDNTTIAEKIMNRIEDLKEFFKSFESREAREQYKRLEKAEKLYLRAVEKAGFVYVYRKIEKKDDIDREEKIQYNENAQFSRKRVKYISYAKIGKENIDFIRGELGKLYHGIDNGIADGVAFENGKTVYIVDSGKEEGNISFGVRKAITISDNEYRTKKVEEINERSISKRYVSEQLYEKLGNAPGNDSGSNFGRELSKE